MVVRRQISGSLGGNCRAIHPRNHPLEHRLYSHGCSDAVKRKVGGPITKFLPMIYNAVNVLKNVQYTVHSTLYSNQITNNIFD